MVGYVLHAATGESYVGEYGFDRDPLTSAWHRLPEQDVDRLGDVRTAVAELFVQHIAGGAMSVRPGAVALRDRSIGVRAFSLPGSPTLTLAAATQLLAQLLSGQPQRSLYGVCRRAYSEFESVVGFTDEPAWRRPGACVAAVLAQIRDERVRYEFAARLPHPAAVAAVSALTGQAVAAVRPDDLLPAMDALLA
jgi:hypothetical protein